MEQVFHSLNLQFLLAFELLEANHILQLNHYLDYIKMQELIPNEMIMTKIFQIRGQKVMLDLDLAGLYQVETRTLKQSVKRNIMRFPEDFMFQLTKKEWREVITNCDNLSETAKFSPFTPFAFQNRVLLCYQVY